MRGAYLFHESRSTVNRVAREGLGDPAGNQKPDKAKSTEKIDGVSAFVMAIGIAGQNPVRAPVEYFVSLR